MSVMVDFEGVAVERLDRSERGVKARISCPEAFTIATLGSTALKVSQLIGGGVEISDDKEEISMVVRPDTSPSDVAVAYAAVVGLRKEAETGKISNLLPMPETVTTKYTLGGKKRILQPIPRTGQ